MVTLEFLGANDTVTGSKTLVKFMHKTYLVDCGLFQGEKKIRDRNWTDFYGKKCEKLDGIFLTHAHLDHSGYIPKIYKEGYRGPIYCSEGTKSLTELILTDAGHIEEETSNFANQSGYSNHKPALPLFTLEDAKASLKLLAPLPRQKWMQVNDNLSVRFIRSGHIIGSSFIQFNFTMPNGTKTITFSGDIGHNRSLTLQGPESITETDVLVMESTYGNRRHQGTEKLLDQMKDAVDWIIQNKGILIVPAFAVGRCQDVLRLIHELESHHNMPLIPVVLDSPMASKAMGIFIAQSEDHRLGRDPLEAAQHLLPKYFKCLTTPEESAQMKTATGPLILISASGMLSGGRVMHHLKDHISNPKNMLLFTGYQAEGTKGRYIQDLCSQENPHHADKVRRIRIHHEEIPILARVTTLNGLSAHGDSEDLLNWAKNFSPKPECIIINHGEPDAQKALAKTLNENLNVECVPVCEQTQFQFFRNV